MGHISEWIKQHPLATGGLVIAIVLLMVLRRSSGGSTAQVAGGPSDNVTIAGIQAGAAQATVYAQASAQARHDDAALALSNHTTDAQLIAQIYGDRTSLDAANLQSQIQQSGIAAQEQISLSAAQAQTEQTRIAAAASTAQSRDSLAAQTTIAGYSRDIGVETITANSRDYMANIDAAVQMQQAGYDAAKTLYTTQAATQIGLANISSLTALGLSADDVKKTLGVSDDQLSGILASIAAQQSISHDSTAAQSQFYQHALDVIQSGVLNKGGEGGTNQVQSFGALFGQQLAGAPQSTTLAQIGAMIAGIGKGLSAAFGVGA